MDAIAMWLAARGWEHHAEDLNRFDRDGDMIHIVEHSDHWHVRTAGGNKSFRKGESLEDALRELGL